MNNGLKQIFFQPYFASLLRNKKLCFVLVFFPLLLVFLSIFSINFWFCPFKQITGLDCPGCGLTRAIACLATGNFRQSFKLHPLAMFFVVGWGILFLSVILPQKFIEKGIAFLDKLERKTGIVLIFLLFFLLFGIVRLIGEIYIFLSAT